MSNNSIMPAPDRTFGRFDVVLVAPPVGPGEERPAPPTLAPTRAARELGLKRVEFELAVQLGRIRTTPGARPGERRVTRAEVDRVRAQDGFPDALRERVRTVGTSEGANLLGITTARFTKLARLGRITPALYYRNRYRATVWLYLAEDLREFKARPENRELLTGRTPAPLKERLDRGMDARARNWRGRYHGRLLRTADGPWQSAAATAAFLDDERIAHVVADADERVHLDALRPRRPVHSGSGTQSPALAPDLMKAADEDEIRWYQTHLALCVAYARDRVPIRPIPPARPRAALPRHPKPVRHRRLLARLLRGRG
ncbi:DUF6397 family protein [Streptomyces uncialis]|uniref:DUF6397 family protein n=1 Tax=Streptomyces uncialis TaxID=1048205 RepID=UPI0022515CCF|nr:DUF6397 family protein [Streptomyces uncialis]MCX4657921.1 DUF6397 family protein [Streptomyces uncialis]